MADWQVKDLSNITGVSVQTLHHYDRIGLLKPSLRRPNGYRLYSEKDLIRLQQIIALKFFGFELTQIKKLLSGNVDLFEHFSIQTKFLDEKAESLLKASQTLKNIVSDYSPSKSISWEKVIQLIEVFRMTEKLENAWVSNVLTPEELKQYAKFESSLKDRYSTGKQQQFETAWKKVVQEIRANLKQDPKSEEGMRIGKKVMDLINDLYGKEHANLKHTIWNKGFKEGQNAGEHDMSPEVVQWMDKAIDGYYRNRIYTILDQISENPSERVVQQWHALMEEMYGNSEKLKRELVEVALKEDRVSQKAKLWLRKL